MNGIHFEPKDGYFAIIRIVTPNPIPSKYRDTIYDRGKSDYFLGSLIKKEGEWYIYINKLKSLPDDEILRIVKELKDNYVRIMPDKVNDEFIIKEGKLLRRRITSTTKDFFNLLLNQSGSLVYSVTELGENDTLMAFKFPDTSSIETASILLDYIINAPFQIDILYLENENLYREPSFFKLLKSFRIDYKEFILIKTEWKMTEEELINENGGIFQNEMSFKPKYFDPDTNGLVGKMIAETKSVDIKGRVGKKIIEEMNGNAVLVEFEIKSKWFSDIYQDVLYPIGGPFFYWGYSDGKGILENYYVIPAGNQIDFLKGLKKHWSEPSRAKHTNTITLVQNIDVIMKEMGL